MTPKHEHIIDMLLANPTMPRGDMAYYLGVTPAWLSTIIHSDIFQAEWARRREECFAVAVGGVRDKLNHLADASLDKLTDMVETTTNMSEVRQAAQLALNRIGYSDSSPGPAGGVQNNYFLSVSSELLTEVRRQIIDRNRERVIEHEAEAVDTLPAPDSSPAKELLAGDGS